MTTILSILAVLVVLAFIVDVILDLVCGIKGAIVEATSPEPIQEEEEESIWSARVRDTITTIKINLNKWVLHLWHSQFKKSVVEALKEVKGIPAGIKSWVMPWLVTVEIYGSLDIVHHGDPRNSIVRVELHLKHEPIQEEVEEIKVKVKSQAKRLVSWSWEREDLDMLEEELIQKSAARTRKHGCFNRKCWCHGERGRGKDNLKTLSRKEGRRAAQM